MTPTVTRTFAQMLTQFSYPPAQLRSSPLARAILAFMHMQQVPQIATSLLTNIDSIRTITPYTLSDAAFCTVQRHNGTL
jgi:hypothetical protein